MLQICNLKSNDNWQSFGVSGQQLMPLVRSMTLIGGLAATPSNALGRPRIFKVFMRAAA